MAIDDYWFKNAVIYCLNVATYMDCNGDGIGDFEGLSRRLDYLHGLGVTCVAAALLLLAQPRQRLRRVRLLRRHARFGTAGDFVECMNHAHALGMRVVVDLVANHTSIDHSWFQSARGSEVALPRLVRLGRQASARPRQRHRVPAHAVDHLDARQEGAQVLLSPLLRAPGRPQHASSRLPGRALQDHGLPGCSSASSGFRMDAVPFLVERKGANVKPVKDFALLQEMRRFLQWRARDAILLAEANVPPNESMPLLGDEGDRLQMMLNFPVNQRSTTPSPPAIQQPPRDPRDARPHPRDAQWVQFLRSHDEPTSAGSPTSSESACSRYSRRRRTCSSTTAVIRRRLAPMLGNDRRRMELAYSLLFSLPGTPMIQYGDEIGMGEDLSLGKQARRRARPCNGPPSRTAASPAPTSRRRR